MHFSSCCSPRTKTCGGAILLYINTSQIHHHACKYVLYSEIIKQELNSLRKKKKEKRKGKKKKVSKRA